MRDTKIISISLSPEENEKLRIEAMSEHVPISHYIRTALNEKYNSCGKTFDFHSNRKLYFKAYTQINGRRLPIKAIKVKVSGFKKKRFRDIRTGKWASPTKK